MATKRFYATGDFRYGTRMLRAGDPVDMDAPTAKLFFALDKIAVDNPKPPKAAALPIARMAEGEKVTISKPPRKRGARRKK